jgi:hypothetical protein
MGANLRHLDEETMAYSLDDATERAASPEKAVSALRELGEALERACNLASEENSTVDAFLETLQRIPVPISRISIDPSLLPDRFGHIEDARINAEGVLIIPTPDGGMETVDLTSFDNRDLLISVLGDLVEKLKGVANGIQVLPDACADVLGVEPTAQIALIETPILEESQESDEVVEPESPEQLSLPSKEIGEPAELRLFVEPEPVEPPVEHISPSHPDPVEYEPYSSPEEIVDPLFNPNVQSGSVLRQFRDQVLRQRREASQRTSRIRRHREAQVMRMRAGAREPWIWEETGVLASLKRLLSRKTGKR